MTVSAQLMQKSSATTWDSGQYRHIIWLSCVRLCKHMRKCGKQSVLSLHFFARFSVIVLGLLLVRQSNFLKYHNGFVAVELLSHVTSAAVGAVRRDEPPGQGAHSNNIRNCSVGESKDENCVACAERSTVVLRSITQYWSLDLLCYRFERKAHSGAARVFWTTVLTNLYLPSIVSLTVSVCPLSINKYTFKLITYIVLFSTHTRSLQVFRQLLEFQQNLCNCCYLAMVIIDINNIIIIIIIIIIMKEFIIYLAPAAVWPRTQVHYMTQTEGP